MFKKIVSLILALVITSSLLCNVAYASSYYDKDISVIVPQLSKSNYAVTLRLTNLLNSSKNKDYAYIAVYNKHNRMLEMQYCQISNLKLYFYITPEEYPVTVKAFVWSDSGNIIPICESYTYDELKSANQIITEQLASFVTLLKKNYNMPGENIMYKLTTILDSIDEGILEDAKNDELVIDKEHLKNEYPDAYAQLSEMTDELKKDGMLDSLITELTTTINGNREYEQLVLTLFTLLGVYDYI